MEKAGSGRGNKKIPALVYVIVETSHHNNKSENGK